ncbi:uncharacterized protein BX664DRAFT_325133 [Halteromyces radiatus]|uniref:uncharacterized protein n=1 Tax=Halteromyces radiatus TaxID=101107 RepID=UPI002220D152|nr:uncharacterized protein BX664DRAFT_325133 [Halteromyces radiatus]KAI8096901.1 hypothetical protein BX664DRAFT_325133 [Halteromyces radiatus]
MMCIKGKSHFLDNHLYFLYPFFSFSFFFLKKSSFPNMNLSPNDDFVTISEHRDDQVLSHQPTIITSSSSSSTTTKSIPSIHLETPDSMQSTSKNIRTSSSSSSIIQENKNECVLTEEEKRQKTLERNRLAASRCRQRKKIWMDELSKKSERIVRRNATLKWMITQLKEEILVLKSQLLAHRGCQCQVIKNYINLHMIETLQPFESLPIRPQPLFPPRSTNSS